MGANDKPKINCAGCGKEILDDWYHYAEVEDYHGHTVKVCVQANRSRSIPTAACLRKVQLKINHCAVCGGAKCHADAICGPCGDLIARGKAAKEALGVDNVRWYALCDSLLGPSLSSFGENGDVKRDTLRLLARVAGQARRQSAASPPSWGVSGIGAPGERNEAHSGCPIVELDEDQKAALLELGPMLAKVMKAQRERGFDEGDNLLRRLALGQVKPGDYEQWSADGRGKNGGK